MAGYPLGDFLADLDLILPPEALEYEVLECVSYTGERTQYGPNGEIKKPDVEDGCKPPTDSDRDSKETA